MPAWQPSLFGAGAPRIDPGFSRMRRVQLDASAWVDYCPHWVAGQMALFDALRTQTTWHGRDRPMYERIVAVPRLMAGLPKDGPGHPILDEITAALAGRYGPMPHISMALYRDGNDSVALHSDRGSAEQVAIISIGTPRHFLLEPKAGGPSQRLHFGWGDLLVMGGTCQRDWLHGVPKTRTADGPRIAVMWR